MLTLFFVSLDIEYGFPDLMSLCHSLSSLSLVNLKIDNDGGKFTEVVQIKDHLWKELIKEQREERQKPVPEKDVLTND